jgi:hypothetical protein
MAYTTINKGSSYFNTKLYTGTGATNNITGVGFKPDLTWIKNRNATDWHRLIDAVRGATKEIYSNSNATESTQAQSLQSFNTDGFTLGTLAEVNRNGDPFVSWNWLGANTTVSNTSGTITSTVSANTTAGFSIVTYTGNGSSSATVGHGLGITPTMIIEKPLTSSVGSLNWLVYHKGLSANNFVYLNFTDAQANASSTGGGCLSTSPTSSTFGFQSGTSSVNNTNANGTNYIAYCFNDVKGFSKMGSYTGNGSTDGTFVYTGFKPAFVIIKISSGTTNNWVMIDNKINTSNAVTTYLLADTSGAQGTDLILDFLSNGFKPRQTANSTNGSGYTYIYMAFAENPFVTSGGIPVTAR